MADIDGDDAGRAARKQNVGEASGRGAEVEADKAGRIEGEGVERRGKLDPATRRPGWGASASIGASPQRLPRPSYRDSADADQPRRDCGLRARAARKEAALDENDIRALTHVAFNDGAGFIVNENPDTRPGRSRRRRRNEWRTGRVS